MRRRSRCPHGSHRRGSVSPGDVTGNDLDPCRFRDMAGGVVHIAAPALQLDRFAQLNARRLVIAPCERVAGKLRKNCPAQRGLTDVGRDRERTLVLIACRVQISLQSDSDRREVHQGPYLAQRLIVLAEQIERVGQDLGRRGVVPNQIAAYRESTWQSAAPVVCPISAKTSRACSSHGVLVYRSARCSIIPRLNSTEPRRVGLVEVSKSCTPRAAASRPRRQAPRNHVNPRATTMRRNVS